MREEWAARTYTTSNERLISKQTESTKQPCGSTDCSPHPGRGTRSEQLCYTSQCHASCKRQRVTHERSNTDNTLRALCPNDLTRIDDPLQLGSRNSCVLKYTRHSRKSRRTKALLRMQVNLVQEHVESKNVYTVEACGAKSRHTCARKSHEISDRNDGGASSISISVCFLWACNVTSHERIERR